MASRVFVSFDSEDIRSFHLHLFETKVEPYQDDRAFHSFVHTTEGLISKENSEWQSYILKDKA